MELEWGSGGYIKKDYTVNEDFKKTVLEYFGVTINDEFPDAAEAARSMNEEISNITHGIIKDLFSAGKCLKTGKLLARSIKGHGQVEKF